MKQEKIRISKPPEERKQEIMDTAMTVFAEKGYEQTTMRDIAEAVGIVPGLCYRYFESKQVLFEAAVRRYVSDYCAPIVQALQAHRGDWEGGMACVTALFTKRDGEERYHSFFHKKENFSFHLLLSASLCDYLAPAVQEFLDSLRGLGAAETGDTASLAKFMLYGQIPIINDEGISANEKAEIIKEYIARLVK